MMFRDLTKPAIIAAQGATKKHLVEMLDRFVEEAKARSPYDTGNNRSSITHQEQGVMSWRVFTATGYGGWLEVGVPSRNRPPRPYFAPAFQIANKEFLAKKGAWV